LYFKPSATPQQLIFVSHVMICVFGFVMAAFACLWNAIGIDLGWLFLTMGLVIGGAVFPAAFTVTWKGQTKFGAVIGAIGGLIAGIAAWLIEAKVHYGSINIVTTAGSYPTLAGNMASVLTGLILTVVVSYIKPDDFDWDITRAINAPELRHATEPISEANHYLATVRDEEKEMIEDTELIEDPQKLQGTFIMAVIVSGVLSFVMDFVIPIPMFLSHYVFSLPFFTAWIVISFVWVFSALFLCGLLPIIETRRFFKLLFMEWFGLARKDLGSTGSISPR
jgi:hypothetical protein